MTYNPDVTYAEAMALEGRSVPGIPAERWQAMLEDRKGQYFMILIPSYSVDIEYHVHAHSLDGRQAVLPGKKLVGDYDAVNGVMLDIVETDEGDHRVVFIPSEHGELRYDILGSFDLGLLDCPQPRRLGSLAFHHLDSPSYQRLPQTYQWRVFWDVFL